MIWSGIFLLAEPVTEPGFICLEINYNIYFEVEKMSAINTEQLAALAEIFKEAEGMEEHFKKFKTIYKNYFHYDQPVNVLEKVAKINQKLGGKSEPTDNESNTEKT